MSGLVGLNKSPGGVVLGLVQLQLPVVATKADLDQQTTKICAMVTKALKGMPTMAVIQRRISPGLIHHTDQGAQYSSLAYRQGLTTLGVASSMSRKGNRYDNAVAESFFSTLKNERLHQSVGYLSPLEFERRLSDS